MPFQFLISRRFWPYFTVQTLGAFNDNFYRNALILLAAFHFAADDTRMAAWLIAACSALFILPFFLFSATAGRLADTLDKARLIRWLKWSELLIMLAAALGFWLMNLWLLLIVLFCMGSQSAFFGPVKYAILPVLLPKDSLLKGNAWVEGATFIAILTGTLIGGWLMLSAYGREVVSVGCVLVSALGLWASYRIPSTVIENAPQALRYNILADTFSTLTAGLREAALRPHMLAVAWFWALGTAYVANLPLFAKSMLAGGSDAVPLLLATFTIGVAVGSGLCVWIQRGQLSLRTVWPGAALIAAGATDFAFTSMHLGESLPVRLLVDLFLIAMGAGLYVVPHYSLLQHRSSKGERGRQLAASNILNALCMVGMSVLGGALLHHGLNVAYTLALLGALTPVWLFFVQKPLLPS